MGGREINVGMEKLCKKWLQEMVGGGSSVFWLLLPLLHSLPQRQIISFFLEYEQLPGNEFPLSVL